MSIKHLVIPSVVLALFASAPVAAQRTGQPCEQLPLPSALPLADYEARLYACLESRDYTHLPGWAEDAAVRDTGPFILGSNYGTHPAVRIYYSPELLSWLENDRQGAIPDGALIIKEMFPPPAQRYRELRERLQTQFADAPQQAEAVYQAELAAALESWTVLVKDHSVSKDGWFWANPAPGSGSDSYDYPFAFPASGAGLGTCLRCHASAESESTFSSLKNINGAALRFRVDESWRSALPAQQRPAAGENGAGLIAHFFQHLPESQLQQLQQHPASAAFDVPDPLFVATFPPATGSGLLLPSASQVQAFPGQWADRVPAAAAGAEHFITSDNCLGCHGGLGGAPAGITMFLQTGPDYGDGYNVSEYGEWRWSPMGLAGRDPIFYAQLESEFALLAKDGAADKQAPLATTCLSCHGAAGQRQLEIDANTYSGDNLDADDFKPGYVLLTTPLTLAEQEQQKQTGQYAYHKYGNLAREGITCTVCHHIEPPPPDPAHPEYNGLENFLMNATTGVFPYSPADQLNGPFDDVKTKPMENALGITPKYNPYIKDSQLCGSCHVINLPNVDADPDKPLQGLTAEEQAILNQAARNGAAFLKQEYDVSWPQPLLDFQHSIEQATFLEWQNSDFGEQSCQDCHMPGGFYSLDGSVSIDQLTTQIATIQDSSYPEAEHELPESDIGIALRNDYRRHELVGLNVFLLELFNQFDAILGVDKSDFMTGATNGNQLARDNMLRQARNDTVALAVAMTALENGVLDISVSVSNKTGHRFPSGVGFRRAFLELLLMRDNNGTPEIVWGSGRTNAVGVIVDGAGKPLATEFLDQTAPGRTIPLYQPHYQTITGEDQVQIYEELTLNARNEFTTSFIHRNRHPKDNRLLPAGYLEPGSAAFEQKFGASGIIKAFMEATRPEGLQGDVETCPEADISSAHCQQDADFQPGQDTVHYRIKLPAGSDPRQLTIKATMYYQAIPPYWLHQRFTLAPEQPATRRLYYLSSHLNTTGTPIENWKLPLVSTVTSVAAFLQK